MVIDIVLQITLVLIAGSITCDFVTGNTVLALEHPILGLIFLVFFGYELSEYEYSLPSSASRVEKFYIVLFDAGVIMTFIPVAAVLYGLAFGRGINNAALIPLTVIFFFGFVIHLLGRHFASKWIFPITMGYRN